MDAMDELGLSLKRKRTPDPDALLQQVAPPHKTAKTSNHLAINYLARQNNEDLPLISPDDTLPTLLSLANDYAGVLDRHESLAFNLGARPLGPILFKRFERLFDGPPKVLKNHGKDGTITWLDVVEFARSKPDLFQLDRMSEGTRVCQFYHKQCRVQISEEDFVLISSGMPQKLIPPQPVVEDEEKELGTLEILEANLTAVAQQADQGKCLLCNSILTWTVATRVRQIRHRITLRRKAILDRRAAETPSAVRQPSPSNVALLNGNGNGSGGFVAVNSRPVVDASASPATPAELCAGASDETRSELLRQFQNVKMIKKLAGSNDTFAASPAPARIATVLAREPDFATPAFGAATPTQTPSTPAQSTPKDDGPYKVEIMARMETIKRGERMLPPCDRCRRLHMDCIKNLTACLGCTRKHAKCAWREVRQEELELLAPVHADGPSTIADNALSLTNSTASRSSHVNGNPGHAQDASPKPGLTKGFGVDTAVENLAAVAQASAAALESTETQSKAPAITSSSQSHHPLSAQQSSAPNIQPFVFSPAHHHGHGAAAGGNPSAFATTTSNRRLSPATTTGADAAGNGYGVNPNNASERDDVREPLLT
jgi:hypothetical protein